MATFNKVILIGNIGNDLELKQTQSGISTTSFSLAVGRKYAGKDQEKQTDWINIVAWRNTAEFICKYFEKGRPILIVGSLQTRSWTDGNGNKRYATEVVADEAQFVDSKKAETQSVPYGGNETQFEEMTSEQDLPF